MGTKSFQNMVCNTVLMVIENAQVHKMTRGAAGTPTVFTTVPYGVKRLSLTGGGFFKIWHVIYRFKGN